MPEESRRAYPDLLRRYHWWKNYNNQSFCISHETHWYESGKLHWLWVAINTKTAVFHIGSRRKEELSYLVQETFMGWLITDGYKAYRSHPRRQRCLAHLIRKAIALSGAINQKAAKIGKFILKELKELISSIAQGFEKSSTTVS